MPSHNGRPRRLGLFPRLAFAVLALVAALSAGTWIVLEFVADPAARAAGVTLVALVLSGSVILWIFRNLRPLDQLLAELNRDGLPDRISLNRSRVVPEFHELARHLDHHIQSIHAFRDEIHDQLNRLKKAMIEVRATFRKQLTTLPRQAASVHETVVTIEQLSQSAASIADSTQHVSSTARRAKDEHTQGIGQIRDIVRAVQSVRAGYDARWKAISQVLRKFEDIRDIIRYVHGMNDQTRLIAFNAAIEAASAGELSKRFNIVASDIRRLATDIDRSGDLIFTSLDEMDASIRDLTEAAEVEKSYLDRAMQLMNRMMAMLERSAKDSVATADAAKQIAQTTQQQQSASQQVAGAARNISLSIDEFFVSAQSTAKVIDEIERLVESLKDKIAS